MTVTVRELAEWVRGEVLGDGELPISNARTLAEAQPGGANEGTCFVANTTAGEVRVRLRAAVAYADGSTSRLTGNFDPGPVQAGGAFELSIFFVIEPDRPLGPAAFTCEVQAQSTDLRGRPETEASSAPFVLVPATTGAGTPTP